MSEQGHSSSQDLEKADSGLDSEKSKDNEVIGASTDDRGVASEENGQKALEKPETTESDNSERDPKLVVICCLSSSREKLTNVIGNMGWSR